MENKKRPIIGIDVDGVLRNNLGIMVDLYNKEFGASLSVDDITDFQTDKCFPLVRTCTGKSSSEWFFQDHSVEIFSEAPAFVGVAEDIKRLREVADICIITYQKTSKNKKEAIDWLDKHGIEYDGIAFLRDKTRLKCDVLVDDNDWNFWNNGSTVAVLVKAPYNKNVTVKDFLYKSNCRRMYRVDSLHEFTEMYLNGGIKIDK